MQILIIESTNSEHSKLLKELAESDGHKVLIASEKQIDEFTGELQKKKKSGEKLQNVLSLLYRVLRT
jgi:hypothetical protein